MTSMAEAETVQLEMRLALTLTLSMNRSAGLEPALTNADAQSRSQTGAPTARFRDSLRENIFHAWNP